MSKSGRSLRLGRLFKADASPLLLVPLDHTVTDGPFTDARGYDALLGTLADNGADAIVVHKGRLRLLPPFALSVRDVPEGWRPPRRDGHRSIRCLRRLWLHRVAP